jgi:hypothetical protein
VTAGLPASPAFGFAQLHSLVADESGAYFTATVSSLKAPTVELLFASPAADAAPAVFQTDVIWRFAVSPGRAWYFDTAGALMHVDLASGQTAQSRPAGTSVPFGEVLRFASNLYWVEMDASPKKYRLVRIPVASDGALGAPATVRESTDAIGPFAMASSGVAWREGRSIMFQPPNGALETVITFDAPETNGRVALNTRALFVTVNDYGPYIDGGCIREPGVDAAPSCTTYPGEFRGAKLVAWTLTTHQFATLSESQTAEILPVAATEIAVYWAETTTTAVPCSTLWIRALGATTKALIASGDAAPRDHLTATSDRAYWIGASGLQHYP